jgi:hypothetical protein
LNILETSKKVIEQTSIELSLVHDISDTIEVLGPLLKEEKLVVPDKKTNNDDRNENKERGEMNTYAKSDTKYSERYL